VISSIIKSYQSTCSLKTFLYTAPKAVISFQLNDYNRLSIIIDSVLTMCTCNLMFFITLFLLIV